MAILVTGGAGYIGSHMVWGLVDRGADVIVLDVLRTGFRWAVAPEAEFVEGDVGDEALLDRLMAGGRIDAVIHFAGSVVVSESVADPLAYYLNNTVRSRALIAACVRNGVRRMVFSSTAAVYGDPDRIPVDEDAPMRPLSPYGASKAMTEVMLADVAAAHDFRYVALRYFNVAGADPAGRTGQSTVGATHLIKVACETVLGLRPELAVFGTDFDTPDGTGVRDYIHVTDLVAAHVAALDHLAGGGASLVANCGYERGYSVLDVVRAVEKVAGTPIPLRLAPRRPGDSPKVVARAARAREILGWRPRLDDLDTIVAHALAWERALPKRNQR